LGIFPEPAIKKMLVGNFSISSVPFDSAKMDTNFLKDYFFNPIKGSKKIINIE